VDDSVKTVEIDGVEPTNANIATNDWKIWAYEHMYTNGEPKALTKDFLDYVLSDEVQGGLVEKMGYVPVSDMKVERALDGTVTNK
jgi:phosphate transport system substrate-binding protein